MTVADRVLEHLRVTHRAWDDDQLAELLQVRPRHTINQVCHRLEAEGRIRRSLGPDNKIVNELVAEAPEPTSEPARHGSVGAPAVRPLTELAPLVSDGAGEAVDVDVVAAPDPLPGLGFPEVMIALAAVRPLFHSEADFQLALAWQVKLARPESEVRLEVRPFADEALYLDLLVVDPSGWRVAVELKYPTELLHTRVAGEAFRLRRHSAHDVIRHDIVKDFRRLERIVDAGHADAGWVLCLTNDSHYWTPSTRATIDAAFRLHAGRVLRGSPAWTTTAGPGTTGGRDRPLDLRGTYRLTWEDFSTVDATAAGRFRYLAVAVLPLLARPGTPEPDQAPARAGQVGREGDQRLGGVGGSHGPGVEQALRHRRRPHR